MEQLLLISGGISPNEYIPQMRTFLADHGVDLVLFVPYARIMQNKYADYIIREFGAHGFNLQLQNINGNPPAEDDAESAIDAVNRAQAIFVGSGNTFLLLKRLQEKDGLMQAIRQRVQNGMPYIGVGAGSNVATASIRTTNDMPIVYPPQSLNALNLVPFNICPHFKYTEETQATRIKEFLALGDSPAVLGLCLGCNVLVNGPIASLTGRSMAKLFRRDPVDHLVSVESLAHGAIVSYLLDAQQH